MSDIGVDLDRILEGRGLTREELKRPITNEHLCRIAVRTGSDWKSCAAFLGIPFQLVEDIEHEEKKVRNMRIKLFSVWKEGHGEEATYLRLAETLAELGRKDLIELLIKMCLQSMSADIRQTIVSLTKVISTCKGKS